MDKINYYLVLEKRLGDYNLIDINKLDICSFFVTNDIAMIDTFTSKYTENEIKASIERSNIIENGGYLEGKLKIISDAKHNLKPLTSDIFTSVINFQNELNNISNNFKSKLFGSYKKVVESTFTDEGFKTQLLDRFKIALKENDKSTIFSIIEELPYAKSRLIYFAIYDEELRKKEEKLRKLEKLNDAA